ncbi:MAG: toxin-antitoxin system protein [Firmicutes bacterium]|nr:toxin-antitoxin system protein [Bacillota bacterium]
MNFSKKVVTKKTWKSLRQTAEQTGMTMQEILEKSVEEYRRKLLLEEANKAFLALKQNTEQWEEELKERHIWDRALADELLFF